MESPSAAPTAIVDRGSVVRMSHISKRFGLVTVLEDVSFELRPGEVHLLAGENGAGKSTLIKILAGVHREYDGQVEINGELVRFKSPLDANRHGIAVIHQELSLIGSMSVADNMFLGRQQTYAGFVRDRKQREAVGGWLAKLGIDVDPNARVGELPVATQQLIEIAKALSHQAQIIVMDEPTSALNDLEVERLFDLIAQLTAEGRGIVYISHKMDEIQKIANRITVLRDGKLIGTAPAVELPVPKLIEWMVGREVGESFHRQRVLPEAIRLEVSNLSASPSPEVTGPQLANISLDLRRGEVVGVGGLEGSGASILFSTLFGAATKTSDSIRLDGEPIEISSPQQAISAGIMLLPSDRRLTGLVLPLSVAANITLASLAKISPLGWRSQRRERHVARQAIEKLGIRAANFDLPAETLSGGNQQKVAIAKCLETEPRVLLLNEPTRGIDIGAKREIYKLLDQWAAQGISILLITSELPELLSLSDRIIVMHRGRITDEFACDEATAERVLAAAMGSPLKI